MPHIGISEDVGYMISPKFQNFLYWKCKRFSSFGYLKRARKQYSNTVKFYETMFQKIRLVLLYQAQLDLEIPNIKKGKKTKNSSR